MVSHGASWRASLPALGLLPPAQPSTVAHATAQEATGGLTLWYMH